MEGKIPEYGHPEHASRGPIRDMVSIIRVDA